MPRPHPHPLTLFSLVSLNDRARNVVTNPNNSHLVSMLPEGVLALDIGFHIRTQSRNTLATLGRNNADITVQGSSIARFQCSFEIDDPATGIVMLYDRSNARTTQVFGDNAKPFELGRIRRIVVGKKVNTEIGMGGIGSDLVRFRLKWLNEEDDIVKIINAREDKICGQEEKPCFARTVDDTPTAKPTQRTTRVHTPGERQLTMRYAQGRKLGSGQFGEVYRAIDVDTGKIMAVKIIERPRVACGFDSWQRVKREVEILARIRHPYVIDYIASQGWGEPRVEIFMGLKEGSLEDLITSGLFQKDVSHLPNTVFHQMLQALDCLAYNGILHRDVKPDNILWTIIHNGDYLIQLTDFGLSNLATNARTYAGSPQFMTPEVLQNSGTRQTSKIDVWSLFVTMAYALNAAGYRQRPMRTADDAVKAALAATESSSVTHIKEMAIVDPDKRASAAQMLVKLYNGVGLSTPGRDVLDLLPCGPLVQAAPVLRGLAVQQKSKVRCKAKFSKVCLARDRVQKRLGPLAVQQGLQGRSGRQQAILEHFHMPGKYPTEK